jgi:DNA-binding MarR family transcriptional regulator
MSVRDQRLNRSLAYSIVRVFRQLNRETGRIAKPFGLSGEQAGILIVLWLEGPLKIGQLQKILMLSSATLTGAIDRMEKAELVRRVPDPADRRAWLVEPADVDSRTRRQLEAALVDFEDRAFSVLTAGERKELGRMLDKISAALPA